MSALAKRQKDYTDGLMEAVAGLEALMEKRNLPPEPLETWPTSNKAVKQSQSEEKPASVSPPGAPEALSASIGVCGTRVKSKRVKRTRVCKPRKVPPHSVKIADRFYRTDSEIDDILMPILTPLQQCVYRVLYRNSYGWGRCVCRLGYDEMLRSTGIKSRKTLQKVVEELIGMGCISIWEEKTARSVRMYRIFLPCEIERVAWQSKRSPNLRVSPIRVNAIRVNSTRVRITRFRPTRIHVYGLHVKTAESTRVPNTPIDFASVSSCGNSALKSGRKSPKDSTKDILKDNNNRTVLLSLLSAYGVKIDKAKATAWANDESLTADLLEAYLRYTKEHATKNPAGFLVRAVDGRWGIEFTPTGPKVNYAVIDKEAEEQEKVDIAKATMDSSELEQLRSRAEKELSGDPLYRRAKLEVIRQGMIEARVDQFVKEKTREAMEEAGDQ